MGDFKKLRVWQKAHALAVDVTKTAGKIRAPQFSSLRSQATRAAMSIDANIAEGRGKQSDKEFVRYLRTAVNSCYELEAHLIMAKDVGALGNAEFAKLLENLVEVRKMLCGLINRLSDLQQNPSAVRWLAAETVGCQVGFLSVVSLTESRKRSAAESVTRFAGRLSSASISSQSESIQWPEDRTSSKRSRTSP